MKKAFRKSQFDTTIKIRKAQHDWIVKVMDTKTLAGFLDKILNAFKECDKCKQRVYDKTYNPNT